MAKGRRSGRWPVRCVVVAAAVVNAVLVLRFAEDAGIGWAVELLLVASWIALLVGERLVRVFHAEGTGLRMRSVSAPERRWADPDRPWGHGRILAGGGRSAREGSFNTGLDGLSFFASSGSGQADAVEERYPWSMVESVAFDHVWQGKGSGPVDPADAEVCEAIVGNLVDPEAAMGHASFVILLSVDCPRRAWEQLMDRVGVRIASGSRSAG